eukprot:12923063-Prorocentrum_lima.AAC.1
MAAVGRVACTGTVAAVDDEFRGIFKEVAPRVKSVAAELCLQQLVSEETGVACNTGAEAYRQVRR